MKIDVVIPAYNEQERIEKVLQLFCRMEEVERIIVVDNASTDHTAQIASCYTQHVLYEEKRGKGNALRLGLEHAWMEYVLACDGDISGLTREHVRNLIKGSEEHGYCLNRAYLKRKAENAPITFLTAKPLLAACFPQYERIDEPLGGIFLVRREFALQMPFPSDWGVDVFLTLRALEANSYHEEEISGISHRKKPIESYIDMSRDVIQTILNYKISQNDHSEGIRQ